MERFLEIIVYVFFKSRYILIMECEIDDIKDEIRNHQNENKPKISELQDLKKSQIQIKN